MEKKFENRIVGITGFSPMHGSYDEMICRIIELEGGIVAGDSQNNEQWEIEQTIIIREEDFSKDYLIQSIEVGIEHNFTCQYFSLEQFWDFYTESNYEPYIKGDWRIEKHAGLSFLASLGFKYPLVDIFNFGDGNQSPPTEWNVESILRANFGYSVRKGISANDRKKALCSAVNSPAIITLK